MTTRKSADAITYPILQFVISTMLLGSFTLFFLGAITAMQFIQR
jgi:cytochrome b559 beta subunit